MAWWPSGILISLLVAVVLGACSGGGGSGRSGRDPVDGMPVGFGGYGSGAGESIEPNGIAVDQANGDVYVVDSNNNRVERFTSRGRFLLAWGWGVADGRTRALQTCMSKCFSGFEGAGAGQLQFAEGVAVDNDPDSASYGDVYVVDLDNRRVQKFSPEGKFLLMFGEEVNQTAHVRNEHASEDVCRASSGDQCKAGPEASVHGLFVFAVEGSFIAVGPNGTVYLGSSDHVLEFNPEGVYQTEITLLPSPKPTGSNELGGVSGLAVNAQGNLYVIRNGIAGIDEYTPSGKLIRNLDDKGEVAGPEGPTPTIAVNRAGYLFADVHIINRGHHIEEYSPTGSKLASFDYGSQDGLHGIAYDERTKALYIVSTGPRLAHVRIVTPP